jgi:hypothetical protein
MLEASARRERSGSRVLSHVFRGEGSKPASNPEAVCDGLHRVSGEGHGYFSGETAFGLGGSNPQHRVRMFPDQYFVHCSFSSKARFLGAVEGLAVRRAAWNARFGRW